MGILRPLKGLLSAPRNEVVYALACRSAGLSGTHPQAPRTLQNRIPTNRYLLRCIPVELVALIPRPQLSLLAYELGGKSVDKSWRPSIC